MCQTEEEHQKREIWDTLIAQYVHNLTSPDGRDTFESTSRLVEEILSISEIHSSDTVVDIGCGWGNLTIAAFNYSQHIIGIEPNRSNIKEAIDRSRGKSIRYIQGSFEKLNYSDKADVVISSLVFHQIKQKSKNKALQNIASILNPDGRFILCDTMMMFDVVSDSAQFNLVYRYLLPKTTPKKIFQEYIKPNLDNDYIYTWDDMKKYTPIDNWYYSINDLDNWLLECGLKICKRIEICPFLGIVITTPIK